MGVLHSYVDRRKKHAVLKAANAEKRRKAGDSLRTLSEYHAVQRRTLFGHVLRAPPEGPMREVTFSGRAGAPKLAPKSGVGAPMGALDARMLYGG